MPVTQPPRFSQEGYLCQSGALPPKRQADSARGGAPHPRGTDKVLG